MKEIMLNSGHVVQLDDEDYHKIMQHNWHYRTSTGDNRYGGYAVTTVPHPEGLKYKNYKTKRVMLQMHRFIMSAAKGQFIDHIDGNTLNNQRSNLRFCTLSENQGNRKPSKSNTSGYRGVRKLSSGKYSARLGQKGRELYLGTFDTIEEAAKAYNIAALEYFGNFAKLNDV